MYELFLKLVALVESFGYAGIFIMTFIESTFVPIPSEITIIPAGYLVASGNLNFYLAYLSTIMGTLGGSLFNYYIARKFGRRLLLNYGNYFFINETKLKSIEFFFERHGAISAFSGRLLPGVKHFISFPAGLGKMDLKIFITYTLAGGAIWNGILLVLGYFIGQNDALIKQYLTHINIALITFLAILVFFYYRKYKKSAEE